MNFVRNSLLVLALGAAIAASPVASGEARAAGQTTTATLNISGGDLVPGAATVPEFHMDFLLDDPARFAATPVGTAQNVEVSLTTPNNSVMRFMFSPRPQFGVGYDPVSGTNRAYAALTWNVFKGDSLYGNFGLASSFDPSLGSSTDPMHRTPLAPLMFHSAVEFGYNFGGQNHVSFSVDQGVIPLNHGSGPEPVDNFTLRYGLKF